LADNTSVDEVRDAEQAPENRRRHVRSVFTYPVEFKLISPSWESLSLAGYLKDISLGGAGLELEDPYGRLNVGDAKQGRVMLALRIPGEKDARILAHVRWVAKKEGASRVSMGISFKNLDYKDLTLIQKLIGLKGKDHTMMWNLWEQYCR
jgi:hypothetical protein